MAAQIEARGDTALSAVPVIALWPDEHALVVGFVPGVALDVLVRRAALPLGAAAGRSAGVAFEVTGRWLRLFHELDLPRPAHLAEPADVQAATVRLAEAVEPAAGAPLVRGLIDVVAEVTPRLTAPFKLGLRHGDLAMRNVLVAPGPSVAIIDTRARWRAPIFEDIAHLFVSLRVGRLQLATDGRALRPACLDDWEAALLRGYGEERDLAAGVRLFGLLVLLDRWSALLERRRVRGRLISLLEARLVDRAFRRESARLVRALGGTTPGGPGTAAPS